MDVFANWIWQGSAVALVATAALRLPRVLGASARYRLWWVALTVVLTLPLLPLAIASIVSIAPSSVPAATAAIVTPGPALTIPTLPPWAGLFLAMAWLAWVLVAAGRIVLALMSLRAARRAVRPFPPEREQRLANWMALRAHGRRAALVLSGDVRLAAVFGGRAPAIAISPAVAGALDDRDLDRIVVHEWAHVQRRDDGARLLQLAVGALAGFHPAVWWLDRQIHIDRETACDDWAVNLTGSARYYAACLTKLAAIETSGGDGVLVPAALTSSDLTRRVLRLLDARRTTSTRHVTPAAVLMMSAVVVSALAVGGVQLVAVGSPARTTAAAIVEADVTAAPAAALAAPATIAVDRAAVHEPGERRAIRERPRADRVAEPQTLPRVEALGPQEKPVPAPTPAIVAAGAPPSPDVRTAHELPGTQTTAPVHLTAPADRPQASSEASPRTAWNAAADAGVSVGRGSQKAAVATAGFFSRLGKSIARSF